MAYRVEFDFPISDPFTLLGGEAVVEEHLRLDIPASGDERDHLLALAEAACRHTIDATGRTPVAGTATLHTSTIPGRMELPFKAATLDSVGYLKDGETSYTTIEVTNFGLFGSHSPAVFFSRDGYTDPGGADTDHPFPFKFVFTTKADEELDTAAVADDPATGEDETAAAVYQTSRVWQLAALLFLSHLYENRQAVSYSASKPVEVPLAFRHLVASIARIK